MTSNQAHFFAIVPPGLESLAAQELDEKISSFFDSSFEFKSKIQHGGIEMSGPLYELCHLNKLLKIPSRILLRVDSFKCRDLPKLFKKIQKYSWNDYLLGDIPEIKVTSKKSRLINTKRISDTITEAIKKYYIAQTPKKSSLEKLSHHHSPTIFIRFEDDICTLSIDTSGEHLHKRGHKLFTTEAPLRANFASALVYAISKWNSEIKELKDPMCGSGTILFEAISFYHSNQKRPYSYQLFPMFEKNEPLHFKIIKQSLFESIQGSDILDEVIQAATKNSELFDGGNIIKFQQEDLFSQNNEIECLILNPPYGKRLAQTSNPKNYVLEIYEHAKKISHHLGILLPKEQSKFLPPPDKKIDFSNGGLDVTFSFFSFDKSV